MAQLMLINPRKRGSKKRKTTMARKRRTTTKRRTTSKRRTSPRRVTTRARRSMRRRTRRNPSTRGIKGMMKTVAPSMAGGAGALSLDILMGYLPLPDMVKTGPISYVTKAALALGLGMVAGNFVKKETAGQLATGALTVVAYNAMKDAAGRMLPNVKLGAYDENDLLAYEMSAYQSPALPVDQGGNDFLMGDMAFEDDNSAFMGAYEDDYSDMY